jgi:dTDP-4-amino-4,6-dideoxygalactose transaminase
LTQGPEVLAFENEFSLLVNERECVAVNSGTSALHLALLSLGIGAGDEVIIPSFTFAATANSVALTGATPVFVDIDIDTYNIDPRLIESAITPRTKAIQVVHLYGLPANMIRIVEIARKNKLLLIEDAAQAHTASINGQPVGTFGDAAAFSFYPTKNMTSGEGGMIVFKDKTQARLAKLYRNQGMEKRYQNELVGFNLRMTDIHAAIGRAQLKHLLKWSKKRQDNAMALSNQLENVAIPIIPLGFSHVFHQYTLIANGFDRTELVEFLGGRGIPAMIYYPVPLHMQKAYSNTNKEGDFPITEDLCKKVFSLPMHTELNDEQLDFITSSVKEFISK